MGIPLHTAAVRTPVSTMLTSRRTVDLCRQRSCLCHGGPRLAA